MKALLSLLLLAPTVAVASTPESTHTVAIYRNTAKPHIVDLDSYSKRATIYSKPPHRQLNPEKKTFQYEGVSLIKLLHLTEGDRDLSVNFVGADGYVSTIPAAVLLKTDAILALKQNSKVLAERDGGVQVIFPTEGSSPVENRVAKKAAFWCWYVRSIIVGDLPNSLRSTHLQLAEIKKYEAPFHFEGPSVFQFEKTKCPNTVRVPLSRLIQSKTISVETLSGVKKEISPETFDLVFSSSQAPLPVICGGPFALFDESKSRLSGGPLLAKDLELNVTQISGKL